MNVVNAKSPMETEPFKIHGKVFRRRRKRSGEEIDAALKSAELGRRADQGILCRECGKRRSWNQIYFKYQWTKDMGILRMWFCDKCNNMIKEDVL